MEQNIFQVVDESHIDEILSQHLQELCVIMYSSKTCPPCRKIKPKFINLAKQHKNIFFIYVDITNFQITSNKYFKEYLHTPTFLFYIGENKVAFIEGAREQILNETLQQLNHKIEEKKKEIYQKEKILAEQKIKEVQNINLNFKSPTPSSVTVPNDDEVEAIELMNRKIDILNKLKFLMQKGVQLSQSYNLNSNYNDMLMEYLYHTNSQYKQHILDELKPEQTTQHVQKNFIPHQEAEVQQDISEAELLQLKEQQMKQQQLKQIQELNIINQRMQLQNIQKLQQLKKIQMMKEQQEKKDFERKE
jgi:thiol-disulfide isomerase/thioredoxin